MFTKLLAGSALLAALTTFVPSPPQATPAPMVATYDTLADAILAIKHTEANLVRSLLQGHHSAALACVSRGDFQAASAEMALFASEGDNSIGGVRKRLLDGGHHHNAAGEAKGLYEPGFVVITRDAKAKALALSARMRSAPDAAASRLVWEEFEALAAPLVKGA